MDRKSIWAAAIADAAIATLGASSFAMAGNAADSPNDGVIKITKEARKNRHMLRRPPRWSIYANR